MLMVVIIEYFSVDRTLKYISDFLNYSNYEKLMFIVVDNSNNEKNFSVLKMKIEKLTDTKVSEVKCKLEVIEAVIKPNYHLYCINPKKNLGFAKGNNLAYRFGKYINKPEYILFTNNDIQLNSKYFDLNKLIKKFDDDNNIGLIGPRVIGLDGKNQSPCFKVSLYKRWLIKQILFPFHIISIKFKKIDSDLMELDHSSYVYRIIGAFMLFRSKAFDDIRGFDNGTFLYAEEPIIAERLQNSGYKTFYEYDVEIIHEEGGTTKKGNFIDDKIIKEKRVFESEVYYFKKYRNKSDFVLFIVKIVFYFYIFKLKCIRFLEQKKRGD